MSKRLPEALVGLALLLATGCDIQQERVFTVDCDYGLEVAKGDNQTGPAGTRLPDTLSLSLRANESMFCAAGLAAQLSWGVESSGGSIAPIAALGNWSAVWTLGSTPGTQRVRATWVNAPEDADPKSVVFNATATP